MELESLVPELGSTLVPVPNSSCDLERAAVFLDFHRRLCPESGRWVREWQSCTEQVSSCAPLCLSGPAPKSGDSPRAITVETHWSALSWGAHTLLTTL